jgi:SPP1 gp7 family putative phage head morphogenesis protein
MSESIPFYHRLASEDVARLRAGAKAAQRVENRYATEIDDVLDRVGRSLVDALASGAPVPDFDLTELLLRNARDAMAAAFETQPKVPARMAEKPRSGKGPSIKIPSNPSELRKWWDATRKGKAPARIQSLAKRIKQAYLHKVQELWTRYGEEFRRGDTFTQDAVRGQMQRAVDVARKRGRTIVATETTRYYNQARRSFYDEQNTITHYLFVSIRDKRTTKWCKTRDGIVYTKGTEILEKETPPTHYQCRSEILPLSPFNPNHKKLIDDPSLRRENRRPAPLLPGWNT